MAPNRRYDYAKVECRRLGLYATMNNINALMLGEDWVVCLECGVEKPKIEFPTSHKNKGGIKHTCKMCHIEPMVGPLSSGARAFGCRTPQSRSAIARSYAEGLKGRRYDDPGMVVRIKQGGVSPNVIGTGRIW